MSDQLTYPVALQELIAVLKQLPGIGSRTAERLALAMLEWPADRLSALSRLTGDLKQRVSYCRTCGNFADGDECRLCANPMRRHDTVCVVEYPPQVAVIERSGSFDGVYHVLGGRLMPLEGRGPEQLNLRPLVRRIESGDIREAIIATSPDVEGEATAAYIARELKGLDVKLSRIAAGIPVGADMAFADSATMAMAISARRPME